jgi:Domain of unknown function (DUF4602)
MKSKSSRPKACASSHSLAKPKPEVIVVQCPQDFPKLSSSLSQQTQTKYAKSDTPRKKVLDWNETAREIHRFGATAFEGKQKRNFKEEEYQRLTGRKMKHHQVPLPIVRGIAKKAKKREERQLKEAKEAGIVLATSAIKKKKKERDRTSDIHGPAPSIGFMKNGVLRVKGEK